MTRSKAKRSFKNGKRLDFQLINLIKDKYEDGESIEKISQDLRLVKNTVIKWANSNELKKLGRPKQNRSQILVETVKNGIDNNCTLYLKEIQNIVQKECGVILHISTIRRILIDLNYSRKKCSIINIRRLTSDVIQKRAEFARWIITKDIRKMVFVDETHVKISDSERKFGYAKVGQRAINTKNQLCTSSFSILAAIDYEGYNYFKLAEHSSKTATNSGCFHDFIKNLIINIPEGSLVILDNAKIHKTQEMKILYHNAEIIRGIKFAFLPPYSPSFNPIELFFNTFKMKLKSESTENMSYNEYRNYVIKSMKDSKRNDVISYFHKAKDAWISENP